jgi:hypothetical protein
VNVIYFYVLSISYFFLFPFNSKYIFNTMSSKVCFINKIKYLVKVEKYLESLIFSDFKKWLAKLNLEKF